MKKGLIFIILLLLLGCNPKSTRPESQQGTRATITPTQPKRTMATSIEILQTVSPTSTSKPFPTIDLTLESIPTPNFNYQPQIRATAASPAKCPLLSKTKLLIPDSFPEDEAEFEQAILDILNHGGIDQLRFRFSNHYEDLTNDGIRELVIRNPALGGNLYVFGCRNGKFNNLLTITRAYDYGPNVLAIKDLNRNGVKDLTIELLTCHYCTGILVYEWNGNNFESLVRDWVYNLFTGKLDYWGVAELIGYSNASIEDIDKNGTFELVLDGGIPSDLSGFSGWDGPFRGQRVVYMWDGKYYVWYSQKFDPPNFRFEAIQDGDTESLRGDYAAATASYQRAIFDNNLQSWNADIWKQLVEAETGVGYPDIKKIPFNHIEYDQLSAYARYRIMILHFVRGWDSDADIVYKTLKNKYPPENPGYPYVEMATIFWEEYHTSKILIMACDQAIAYADQYPEILKPLGPHGVFDLSYEPESICPIYSQP